MMIIFVLIACFALVNCDCPARRRRYPDYSDHPCKRECVQNISKVCEYDLNIQYYFTVQGDCRNCTMGNTRDCYLPDCIPADGRKRMIKVFNGMMPGPAIEVCQNDEIVIHLKNKLGAESTSIHFHGILQKNSQWMDGVPMVTQCPILPMSTFTYRFKAEQEGTHFYHSHSGTQRGDGAYGALIIRQPDSVNAFKKSNAISDLNNFYDKDLSEHVIILSDWTEKSAEYHLRDYARNKNDYALTIRSILVNSFGSTNKSIPLEKFYVQQGESYRFRFINTAMLSCLIKISIEDHKIYVISSDGSDIDPIAIDALSITNGERYDFVVRAVKEPKQYKIQFLGYAYCENINTSAILEYTNSADTRSDEIRAMDSINGPNAIELNDVVNYNPNALFYENLQNLHPTESSWNEPLCYKEYLGVDIINERFDNYEGFSDNELYNLFVNNISNILPSKPLLFNKGVKTCNSNNLPKWCNGSYCQCPHVQNIPVGCLVELILIDLGTDLLHPIHFHGHKFWVIGQGKIGNLTTIEEVKNLDRKGLLNRNNMKSPILKDTVSLPDGGYTIVRFVSNNPGYWLLHCHSGFHVEEGMGLILKTGKTLPKVPVNFPNCGDWTTKVEDETCHIV